MRDLIIAGVMKAGTTSLFRYLSHHPDIAASVVKETHYYADDLRGHFAPRVVTEDDVLAERALDPNARFHHARIQNKEVYDSLFPTAGEMRVRMEASPSYLPSDAAAHRIANEACHPFIVVVLRNPYDRMASHFEMNKVLGVTERTLLDELEKELSQGLPLVSNGHVALTRLSMYASGMQRLIGAVGRDQIVVVRTQEMETGVESVLSTICDHVGIAYVPGMLGERERHNPTLDPKSARAHRFLVGSGLLGFAKRTVPTSIKRRLIGLYYKERRREIAKYEAAQEVVRPSINRDLECLSEVLQEDFTDWILQ